MRNLVKALLFVVGLAVYLNIGWVLGTYFHENVVYSAELKGPMAVFLAGPGKLSNHPTRPEAERKSMLTKQIGFSLLWPLMIMVISLCWIVYGFGLLFWWIVWLVFWGGIAKPFGVG